MSYRDALTSGKRGVSHEMSSPICLIIVSFFTWAYSRKPQHLRYAGLYKALPATAFVT